MPPWLASQAVCRALAEAGLPEASPEGRSAYAQGSCGSPTAPAVLLQDLAGALTSYSERGQDYVKTLRGIISYNKLGDTDDAYLEDMRAMVLVSPDD